MIRNEMARLSKIVNRSRFRTKQSRPVLRYYSGNGLEVVRVIKKVSGLSPIRPRLESRVSRKNYTVTTALN
jgi:hypothetical protein